MVGDWLIGLLTYVPDAWRLFCLLCDVEFGFLVAFMCFRVIVCFGFWGLVTSRLRVGFIVYCSDIAAVELCDSSLLCVY